MYWSYLDDISWKWKSLQFERKIDMKSGGIWTHDLENLVYHANH